MQGIARACIPNPDSLLHNLLVGAIEDCKTVHTPEPRHARVLIVGKERNAAAVAVATPPATTLMPRREELDCAGWIPVRFLRPWEGDYRSLDRTWLGSSRWPEPQHRHGTRWPTVVSIPR